LRSPLRNSKSSEQRFLRYKMQKPLVGLLAHFLRHVHGLDLYVSKNPYHFISPQKQAPMIAQTVHRG
ncbi:hypothetical protein, partial [Sutterella wadsworthensis]|uniref:hypothetical protein n=1 Tax=Sutterella wadsworthensis TaxID=40545 RepID=UPI00242F73B8